MASIFSHLDRFGGKVVDPSGRPSFESEVGDGPNGLRTRAVVLYLRGNEGKYDRMIVRGGQ